MTRILGISVFIGPFLIFSQSLHAQLLRPSYVTPDFSTTQTEFGNWEYSRWDRFYTPHDEGGTLPQNRNYPDVAAPNGYAVSFVGSDEIGPLGDVSESPAGSGSYAYVGSFNGEYVWAVQSFTEAVASGFAGTLPTNPNPALPRTIFHTANPSIRQHASSAFIIGAGFTGNIYSPFALVSYTLDDSLTYDAGSVVFQFQNQGRDVDMNSIRLRYHNGSAIVEVPAADLIIEREAFASHAGFTFTTRAAVEWNVAGLGIRDYEIVWKAAGTSCSLQEVLLDTADAYIRDKGLPAKRLFTGASGAEWDQAANWTDAAGATSPPLDGANLVLQGGNVLDIGSMDRHVSLLETNLPGNFQVQGSGSIELGTGLNAAAATIPKRIDFEVPVKMTAFNFFDVGTNVTVSLNQPFSGQTGFEKRGPGELHLAGDNSFTGALFVSGGRLAVSGANSYGAPGGLDLTYIYLGEIVLEPGGVLGAAGVNVSIGSTPYETPGESRSSRLVVKGERDFSNPVDFTGGYNPKRLTFTETGAGTVFSGPVTLHDGSKNGTFGVENPTGEVILETPLASDKVRFTGTFTGGATILGEATPHALHKTGPGTLVFGGSGKAYRHQTHIEQGTLLLESGTAITGGNAVTVDAGATFTAEGPVTLINNTLRVNGLFGGAGPLVLSGTSVFSGDGTIAKLLSIGIGTVLSPGNGVGSLAFTGNQVWGENAGLVYEINGAGTVGTHDLINISGSLALAATQDHPFVIKLHSLDLIGAAGRVHDFNPYGSYIWTIATATGGITGFNPAAFVVDATAFANAPAGTFSVENQGTSLVLRYTRAASSDLPFAVWAGSLPAGLQGPEEDPDHDGIGNLIEFATGTAGNTADPGGKLLTIREGTQKAILEFTLAEPVRPGVTVKLTGSEDLAAGSWQVIGTKAGVDPWQGIVPAVPGEPGGTRRSYSVSLPITPGEPQPRFFRLEFRNEE